MLSANIDYLLRLIERCLKKSSLWLLTRLTICSLCFFLLKVILVISRFGFEGWIWVLIASVPGLCIPFTYMLL